MKKASIKLYRGLIKGYREIKAFLFSKANKEFLIFLLFFVVSSVFWLLKTLDEEYEEDFNIPVKIINLPENAVVVSDVPSTVKVTLKDRGTMILRYLYGTNFSPIVINYNDYTPENMTLSVSGTDLRRKIIPQLASSTRLSTLRPDGLTLEYVIGNGKKVPVRFKGDVKTEYPYFLSGVKCRPDSVTVFASTETLAHISAVYTQAQSFPNFKESRTVNLPLQLIPGTKITPGTVKVTLFSDMYTEKTVEVPIVGVNFPAEKMLRTFPSKVNVSFQIGLSRFKTVKAEDFISTISYEELLNATTPSFNVTLKSYPPGIKHIKIDPPTVDFLIEQVNEPTITNE